MANEKKLGMFDKDVEAVLKQNMKHISPTTNVKKDTDSGKKIFPFWTPVGSDVPEVFTDVEAYLKKPKKEDFTKTALNKMDDLRKTADKNKKNKIWADNSVIGSIKNWTDALKTSKQAVDGSSKVGVVKPLANDLKATAGAKPITSVDYTKDQVVVVEKAAKAPEAKVGAVKPLANDLKATSGAKPITNVDYTKDQVVKVEKSAKAPEAKVGVVKPEISKELKATSGAKPITSVDYTKDQVVKVEKAAKAPEAKVGVVKPLPNDLKATASK